MEKSCLCENFFLLRNRKASRDFLFLIKLFFSKKNKFVLLIYYKRLLKKRIAKWSALESKPPFKEIRRIKV
mgnify:CR=1 FL=1